LHSRNLRAELNHPVRFAAFRGALGGYLCSPEPETVVTPNVWARRLPQFSTASSVGSLCGVGSGSIKAQLCFLIRPNDGQPDLLG